MTYGTGMTIGGKPPSRDQSSLYFSYISFLARSQETLSFFPALPRPYLIMDRAIQWRAGFRKNSCWTFGGLNLVILLRGLLDLLFGVFATIYLCRNLIAARRHSTFRNSRSNSVNPGDILRGIWKRHLAAMLFNLGTCCALFISVMPPPITRMGTATASVIATAISGPSRYAFVFGGRSKVMPIATANATAASFLGSLLEFIGSFCGGNPTPSIPPSLVLVWPQGFSSFVCA